MYLTRLIITVMIVGSASLMSSPATAQTTFTERGNAAGVDYIYVNKGVVWGDYNNDGFVDLYVTNSNTANQLYKKQTSRIMITMVTGSLL